MTTNTKLPTVGYTEIDNSGVLPDQLAGYHGIITPTLFGPDDAPVKITTVEDFKATFGAESEMRSPFFPQIKRALQRGVGLYVQRLTATAAAAAAIPIGPALWLMASANVTITAKYKGAWANGLLGIDFVNGTTNTSVWGLKVRYALNTDIEETFTAATFDALVTLVNTYSKLITIVVTGTAVPMATTTTTVFMAAGADGAWADDAAKATAVTTLFHKFDDVLELDTISCLGLYTATHLQNLKEYCEAREDVFGIFEVDPTLIPSAALTFMNGLSAVSSTYVAIYYGSTLSAYNVELQKDVIGGITMDVIGVFSYNDTVGERYHAPAGANRGLIPNVKTFAYNMLSPARKTDADALVATGCNIVGKHPSFGPCVWGASTFNKGVSANGPAGTVSALDAIHVRRMLIDLHRSLMPVYQSTLFESQSPKSWRNAYGKAKVILKDLEAAEAIYPGWGYVGDQGASKVEDARFNKPADLALGHYKVLIPLVPVGFINAINFTVQVNSLLSMFSTATTDVSGAMPTVG